jgi:hypothetical protein
MPVYTDPFGGSTIQPAQVAYSAIALSADVTLVWPQESFSAGTPVFSRLTDVTPSGAGFAITLPDAQRVSNGYDAFFSNRGGSSFIIKDASGATIATVAVGEVRYLYLVDNTSVAGTWRSFGMGALTSTVDAASLVGRGIAADGTTLRVSQTTSTFSSNYSIVAADLAKAYVWTGGAGTLTLPLVAAVNIGVTFFFSVSNQGTGALTVTGSGGETVDGAASIVLQPSESCILHAGPTAWYSVGRGRNALFNYTLLSKSVTGGTVTLTPSEASNVAQIYTGVLVSACTVVLPSVVQVYFISNQTTGAFTLTFKTAGVGSTIAVPQGQNAVLLCDGLNVINSSTTISGITSLSLAVGAVGSPSLSFVGDPTTGLYQIASGNFSITITGTQRFNLSATGLSITGNLTISGTGAFTGVVTGPTAAVDTNTTQLATTAFVIGQAYAKLASPTFTGTPAAPTASPGTNTTQLATTAFVAALGALKANLASPTFTGTPAAPTAAVDTNTTQLATTAFVIGQGYAKGTNGTYTPTGTGVANVATITPKVCRWIRSGNEVFVSGIITMGPTSASTLTQFRITLPVTSNFTGDNAAGIARVMAEGVGDRVAYIGADSTNDALFFTVNAPTSTSAFDWAFTASYTVQ